ncbi:MAG: tRNA-dihydrouridine synthase [Proteobacteria bacterium]|nr:tRNA-dihydrouridine synthase [Pseudomonadota bacterium]
MRIVLAPMEGLADVHLRRLITAQGGYDWVVSEFVRVVDRPLPDHVFHTICPELLNAGKTASGTPVRVQLLGNHLEAMASNARTAAALGSHGVDINFGCPSKTVNRSQGGAILLREPESLFRVVEAVRNALPADMTVSAKMRLGFDDTRLMLDNAAAIEAGGACEMTVHARTRAQGYAPPAHWDELARIRSHVQIPVIANGDIWSVADYHRCSAIAGTQDVMLGRGAVRHPDLARRIRSDDHATADWAATRLLLMEFWADIRTGMPRKHHTGRVKQWVNHLRQVHPPAETLWREIRTIQCPDAMDQIIRPSLHDVPKSAR